MSRNPIVAPYFMHNIDGRNCGVVVARNKRQVAKAFRVAEPEIEKLPWKHPNPELQAGITLASGEPGTMFVFPILGQPESPWRAGAKLPTSPVSDGVLAP